MAAEKPAERKIQPETCKGLAAGVCVGGLSRRSESKLRSHLEVSAYIRRLIVAAALLTSIVVDHPFFFAITEQESGAVLFAGIVMDPTLTGGAR